MRILLLVVFLLNVFFGTAWSKTYSCRDSSGTLHFSDNLQGLPEECLGKEKVVDQTEPDNLNYVPASQVPAGSGTEFKHSVRAAEREAQQKESQLKNLNLRAESLLERYTQATREKRQAKRSWNYSSRDKIKQADNEIEQVRTAKQQLLEELSGASISSQDKGAIEEILVGIPAK